MAFLDQLAARNVRVMITELDVVDEDAIVDPVGQDQRVAGIYRTFLKPVLGHAATVALMTWGLSDRYSWLRYVRWNREGNYLRPLPFDESNAPKLACEAISKELSVVPFRS
jgi:endo-1,4-beta-xylanase